MSSISVALVASRAIELRYPLEAVLTSVAPVVGEIVVGVDSTFEGGTGDEVIRIGARVLRDDIYFTILRQEWDWSNREGGSEIAIQSNKAVEACGGDWILHLQADEMLHEDDHDYLKWLTETLDDSWAGIEFERLYFWRDLHTLRTDWTQPLVRMFRRGRGRVAGDGINCEVDGKVWPVVRDGPVPTPSLWHYSRIGDGASIAKRIQTLDSLFHDPELIVNSETYDWELKSFDSYAGGTDPKAVPQSVLVPFAGSHPEPARRLYGP